MSRFDAEFVKTTIRIESRSAGALIRDCVREGRGLTGMMRRANESILYRTRRRYAALMRLTESADQVAAGLDVIHAAERHAETCPCADELDATITAWKESNRT